MRVDRAHTKTQDDQAVLRVKTFWNDLEDDKLGDIRGVLVELLRATPSIKFGFIYEYDITIIGDSSRQRIVQNAIVQTLKRNAGGRRLLINLANRMYQE